MATSAASRPVPMRTIDRRGRESRRVEDEPLPVDADLDDGVRVHGRQTRRVHRDVARRHPDCSSQRDDEVGVVAGTPRPTQQRGECVIGRRGGPRLVGQPLVDPRDDPSRPHGIRLDAPELGVREAGEPVARAVAAREDVGERVGVADLLGPSRGECDRRLVRQGDLARRGVDDVQAHAAVEGDLAVGTALLIGCRERQRLGARPEVGAATDTARRPAAWTGMTSRVRTGADSVGGSEMVAPGDGAPERAGSGPPRGFGHQGCGAKFFRKTPCRSSPASPRTIGS